jgi:AraC family transcriptional regulator
MDSKSLFVASHFSVAHSIVSSAIPLHAHSEYVLGYHFRGNSLCRLGPAARLVFRARNVSLLNPGEAHEDFSTRLEREYLNVSIKKEFFDELAKDAGGIPRNSLYFLSPKVEGDLILTRLCELMRNEIDGNEYGRAKVVESLVTAFAVYILRRYTPGAYGKSMLGFDRPVASWRIRKALQQLRETYTAEFNLTQLATTAGLSKFYFERSFKKAIGFSPHSYAMLMRVEKAKELLVSTDQPIAEIAVELGFSDQSHFTNLFKRFLRVTPHAYRLGTK